MVAEKPIAKARRKGARTTTNDCKQLINISKGAWLHRRKQCVTTPAKNRRAFLEHILKKRAVSTSASAITSENDQI